MKRESLHLWPYMLTDSVCLVCAWLLVYWLRFSLPLVPIVRRPPVLAEYLTLLFLFIPLWLFFIHREGLYHQDAFKRPDTFFHIVGACILSLAIGLALIFFYREYSYSRLVVSLFGITSPVFIYVGRILAAPLALRALPPRRVLMIGANCAGVRAANSLLTDRRFPSVTLVGYLDDAEHPEKFSSPGPKYLGDLSKMEEIVGGHNVNTLLFCGDATQSEKEYKCMRTAVERLTVDIQVLPWMLDLARLGISSGNFFNVPSIGINESPLVGFNAVLKRILDVFVASIALVALFIPCLVIAIAIRITMGKPIFFTQERLGFNGEKIRVIKFRTMVATREGEEGTGWSTADDPRRTALGIWLRRFGLDEIPQFWNVLKGEMSMVGPRPEQPVYAGKFMELFSGYLLRLKIKAGITGWAQINGLRGDSSIEQRLVYDLEYIRRWSLWLDIKIIILTCLKFFFMEGAN